MIVKIHRYAIRILPKLHDGGLGHEKIKYPHRHVHAAHRYNVEMFAVGNALYSRVTSKGSTLFTSMPVAHTYRVRYAIAGSQEGLRVRQILNFGHPRLASDRRFVQFHFLYPVIAPSKLFVRCGSSPVIY